MTQSQTIVVNNESDIVMLRMQVRDLARSVGLNLADQARISLAASSVVKAIGLGITRHGKITMDSCQSEDRVGVRIVCTEENGSDQHSAPPSLGETRWMVDELTLETLPHDRLQVTLVKWRA